MINIPKTDFTRWLVLKNRKLYHFYIVAAIIRLWFFENLKFFIGKNPFQCLVIYVGHKNEMFYFYIAYKWIGTTDKQNINEKSNER